MPGFAALLVGLGGQAHAIVTGWMGEDPSAANGDARTFVLTAKHDVISTSDGNSHYAWGYARTGLQMQYPGPTLIVNQGDTVKIVLNNTLPVPVSIIFPGQQGVTASGGNAGLLTREARAASCGRMDHRHRRRRADLHLRRLGAGYLPVSQRYQSGPAGRDGAGRRADRSAERVTLPLNKRNLRTPTRMPAPTTTARTCSC